jgi:rRNA maturation protein Nop10
LNPYEIVLKLIPDEEEVYDLGEIRGRCGGRRSILVPTTRRLMICRMGLFGFKKKIDDYSWGKFDHIRINEGWISTTLELRFRRKDETMKLEGTGKDDFRKLYKRIRERITKYDDKFMISFKICRQCGETVNYVAKKCPHCGREFKLPEI